MGLIFVKYVLPDNIPDSILDNTSNNTLRPFPVLVGYKYGQCYSCYTNNIMMLRMPKYGFPINSKNGGWAIASVDRSGRVVRVLSKLEATNVFYEVTSGNINFMIAGG